MADEPAEKASSLTAVEAFAMVGNSTRMAILRTLSEVEPVSFTGCHERAGIPDSGQFNDHINDQTGQFVSKTGGPYALGGPDRADGL